MSSRFLIEKPFILATLSKAFCLMPILTLLHHFLSLDYPVAIKLKYTGVDNEKDHSFYLSHQHFNINTRKDRFLSSKKQNSTLGMSN